MALPRYGVSVSAGQRDGKRFAVWDRHERKPASWHRTLAEAQRAARALNRGA